MARPRLNLLMILPPLAFLGFAAAAYVALKRDNPDELPSALVGQPAPGLTAHRGAPRRPGADGGRPHGAGGEARELLRELVRPLPHRAPGALRPRRRRACR